MLNWRHINREGERRTFGWLDVNDVPLALADLQTRSEIDPQRIGLLGFSIGGQIALRAAAQSDQLKVVVAEEPAFARISDVPDMPGLLDNFYDVGYWARPAEYEQMVVGFFDRGLAK